MRFALMCSLIALAVAWASDSYPPSRFTDSSRAQKLESAILDVDKIFRDYLTEQKIPGMVWGIVVDGRLAHVGTAGVRDRAADAPVTPETAFRIASMTKSFTILAILKLRDEGKLSLEDPVSKWIPEFARMELPTSDSAPLKLRQLMSHSAGWPEDNPWGDQQLAATDDQVTQWLRLGIPFSTPPDTRYEYSNYAFGLLGRVVARVSGVQYEKYVRTEILMKLGMSNSSFQFSDVPLTKRAIGYRIRPDGTYLEEPPVPQGAFSSAGGLLTTAADLGRYVAFHLSAWPPRDDPETDPVRRSSVREMSHMWNPSNLAVRIVGGKVRATQSGYGYGLRISADCRFEHIVGHGGGLPGFGSYMMWLPDYGVGIFAMANLTYSGPSEPINRALDAMLKTGGLQKRELPASPMLAKMREHIFHLWQSWDDREAKEIASMNLFLDAPVPQRRAEVAKLKEEVGECTAAGPVVAENWLRGQFNLTCTKGLVGVFYTLSPTQPPLVQHLAFRKIDSDAIRVSAPTGAPAGIACSE
jgi:CubicO group peptidase (beta-lactamase class C family)